MAVTRTIHPLRMQSIIGGNFESLQSVKNFERLSKKQRNNQPIEQSGTGDLTV